MKEFKKDRYIGASTGSRIFKGINNATKGGMPIYKLIGNVLLTKFSNFLTNTNYTDAHTGLWIYNLRYLKKKNYNHLTDTFNFDQDFRFMNIIKNRAIKEIPIRTKYGDERSQMHINYALKFFFNTIMFYLIKIKVLNSNKY